MERNRERREQVHEEAERHEARHRLHHVAHPARAHHGEQQQRVHDDGLDAHGQREAVARGQLGRDGGQAREPARRQAVGNHEGVRREGRDGAAHEDERQVAHELRADQRLHVHHPALPRGRRLGSGVATLSEHTALAPGPLLRADADARVRTRTGGAADVLAHPVLNRQRRPLAPPRPGAHGPRSGVLHPCLLDLGGRSRAGAAIPRHQSIPGRPPPIRWRRCPWPSGGIPPRRGRGRRPPARNRRCSSPHRNAGPSPSGTGRARSS